MKNKIRSGKIEDFDECDPGECHIDISDVKAEAANRKKKIVCLSEDEEIAVAEGVLQTATGHLIVHNETNPVLSE